MRKIAGSNTFGGTIKLEGEKTYRDAIKQINSDLKVMASEMSKVTAELVKMVRSTPRPVGEAGVLTNRKKHRELQAAARKATMFLTGLNPPLPSPLETKFWPSKSTSKKKKYRR